MDEEFQRPTVAAQNTGFFTKHFLWLRGCSQEEQKVFCSFCRESYKDVGPLVEGPDEVFICRLCVRLCNEILDAEEKRRGGSM